MATMIRTVAKVQGSTLILLAASSLLVGDTALHGALHIELSMNIIHFITGGWSVLAGFVGSDKTVYVSVAVLSALFLVMGAPALFSSGIVANDYSWIHEAIRLVVAGLGVTALVIDRVHNRRLRKQSVQIHGRGTPPR